jgi:predicted nicotinamide N-methyase
VTVAHLYFIIHGGERWPQQFANLKFYLQTGTITVVLGSAVMNWLLLYVAACWTSTSAFQIQYGHHGRRRITPLFAKTNKRKPSKGRGSRNQAAPLEATEEQTQAILRPSTTKKLKLSFPDTTISVVQVDDFSWWEKAENPYGGRLWPTALGIAQFLLESNTINTSTKILELGCGTGLPSLMAASLGATVVATDISTVVLQLLQDGWKGCHPRKGSLVTQVFDVTDYSVPLPDADIVIASAVLYEADLAEALGRRVVEACAAGAWVILGDDDTGEREGGREIFLNITDKAGIATTWTEMTVANKELGWQAKAIKLIHFNAPKEIQVEL